MSALNNIVASTLTASALALLALGAGGCRGERSDNPPRQFFPDMDDQPKWRPQSESNFYADGRTMRPRVPGAVPFGVSTDAGAAERAALLKDDPAFYHGVGPDGEKLVWIPESAVDAYREAGEDTGAAMTRMLAKGQERFTIYCAVCHNYTGDGKGAVGSRWSYPLPDWHDVKYTDRSQPTARDGHIFDVIRHGLFDQTGAQKMPAYGHAIDEKEAWAIVAYVRTLQESWTTDLGQLPAGVKQQLESSRRPAPPPAAAPATPAGQQPPATPAQPQPAPQTPPTGAPPQGAPDQQQEGGR